jgi:hypothetical protein
MIAYGYGMGTGWRHLALAGGLRLAALYTGSFVRIDSIYAFPGLIGASRPAA